MDLNLYLDPISLEKPENYNIGNNLFRDNIFIHTQNNKINNKEFDLCIVGIPEDRNSINKGCSKAPDIVRNKLYQLAKADSSIKIADFGNIKTGNKIDDAYYAVRDVTYDLLSNNVLPILIGGSQDLTYGIYLAYKKLNKSVNLVTIDSRIDIGTSKHEIDSYTYLSKILFDSNKYLDDYVNLGHQSYFVPDKNMELLKKLFYNSWRIGHLRSKFYETEPILRDADLVSIDMCSIKQSDSPAHKFSTPNGFYSEEICQLARYSGIGDNVTSFGIFEINPEYDINHQSAHLAAQIIWLFIDGFTNRYNEKTIRNNSNLKKFIVNLDNINKDIVFYKSKVSNRWWMEIPIITNNNEEVKVVSCSELDYKKACNNEMPDKWINAFQKIN